jgi:uncharacterized protein (TIGR02266 family)
VAEHPAEQAKALIGQALAAIQDDRAAEGQLAVLASTLASAQRNLFAAGNNPPSSLESVQEMRAAMELLARALQILQDLKSTSSAVGVAAKSVASCLATLFGATQNAPKTPSRPPPPPPPAVAVGARQRDPGVAPPPTMDDRRMKTIQLQLDSVIDVHGDTTFYTGLSGNIDEGGIFIATFDQKPINSKIAVSFTLPSGDAVITRGTVRWLREYNPANPDVVPGMGVRFMDLRDRDRKVIEKFLETKAPLFYDDE